jgi:RNA polymerase sigma-70 factor (family 1)
MKHRPTSLIQPELHQLIAAGDTAAFSRLYERTKRHVYKAAYAVLKCREEAQEIRQETFAAVWRIRGKCIDVKSFENYLYITARNKAITLLRKRRQEEKALHDFRETAVVLPPDSLMEIREYAALYENSLNKLPPRQRAVFRLSREEKMSHEEIANDLNIAKDTVTNHIKAALKTMRSSFSQHLQRQ